MDRTGKKRLGIALWLALMVAVFCAMACAETLRLPAHTEIIEAETFYGARALESVELPDGIREIRNRAFADSSLELINLPSSIKYIADDAFDGSENVTVYPDEGSYAYFWAVEHGYIEDEYTPASEFSYRISDGQCEITKYNGDAEEVRVPPMIELTKVTAIGAYAFANNNSLESVEIPNGIEIIGFSAFSGCTNLFMAELPDSVREIQSNAFYQCATLEWIYLPNDLHHIPARAFSGCTALEYVGFPGHLQTIGPEAFFNCDALSDTDIPFTVTEIGERAFGDCGGLTSISLPKGLKRLGASVFSGCVALLRCTLSQTMAEIPENAFNGCTALERIDIPYSITRVGNMAFANCTRLMRVDVPGSVTAIGDSAFAFCPALERVTIADGVTSVGDWAFHGCESLSRIDIPASVTRIADYIIDAKGLAKPLVIYGRTGSYAQDYASAHDIGFRSLTPEIRLDRENVTLHITQKLKLNVEVLFDTDGTESVRWSSGNERVATVSEDGTVTSAGSGETVVRAVLNNGTQAECTVTVPEEITVDTGEFVIENGILRIYKGNGGDVVIPDDLGIWKIEVKNGGNIFKTWSHSNNWRDVTSLTLPEGLEEIGWSAFDCCKKLEWVQFPDTLKTIGASAFLGCDALGYVDFPGSLETILNDAFRGCDMLDSLYLPDSVTTVGRNAFYNCSSIEEVRLPESPATIGEEAFAKCGKLKEISIPGCLETIGRAAFSGVESAHFEGGIPCTGDAFLAGALKNITVSDGVTVIPDYAFANTSVETVSLPDTIEEIDSCAFYHCSKLKALDIPSNVKHIGFRAFDSCSALRKLDLPEGIESIEACLFYECKSLEQIDWPANLDVLPASTFYKCSNLTSVTLHDGLTSIGEKAFEGCAALETISIPNTVTEIPKMVFYNCAALYEVDLGCGVASIGEKAFTGCVALDFVVIPSSVTTIGFEAFSDLHAVYFLSNVPKWYEGYQRGAFSSKLTSVTVADGAESIGAGSFKGCSGLRSVVLADSIQSIGQNAFQDCTALTELTLPASLTAISWEMLMGCSGLTELMIPEKVSSIDKYAFRNCAGLRLVDIPETVQSIYVYVKDGHPFTGCHEDLTLYVRPNSYAEAFAQRMTLPFRYNLQRSSDYTYYLDDNDAIIVGYSGSGGMVNVPNTLDGHTVKRIDNSVFANRGDIENLRLPLYLDSIGPYAFFNCDSLTTMSVPKYVTRIEVGAFGNCDALTRLTIPESAMFIDDTILDDHNETLVLYGEDGSEAEAFAQAHDIPFNVIDGGAYCLVGDLVSIDALYRKVVIDHRTFSLDPGIEGELLPLRKAMTSDDKRVICYIEGDTVRKIDRVVDVLTVKMKPTAKSRPELAYRNGRYYYGNEGEATVIRTGMDISFEILENEFYTMDDLRSMTVLNDTVTLTDVDYINGEPGTLYELHGTSKVLFDKSELKGAILRLGDTKHVTIGLNFDAPNFVPGFNEVRSSLYLWLQCDYEHEVDGETRSEYVKNKAIWHIHNYDYEEALKEAERARIAAENERKAKEKALKEKTDSTRSMLEDSSTVRVARLNYDILQYVNQNQAEATEVALTAWICGMVEATQVSYLNDSAVLKFLKETMKLTVVEKKLDLFGWVRTKKCTSELRIVVPKGKRGKTELVFHIDMDNFAYGKERKPNSALGDVTCDIIVNGNIERERVPMTITTYTNVRQFCDALKDVAEQAVRDAYNESWGKHANEVADILFNKMVIDMVNNKYGSFSDAVFTVVWNGVGSW